MGRQDTTEGLGGKNKEKKTPVKPNLAYFFNDIISGGVIAINEWLVGVCAYAHSVPSNEEGHCHLSKACISTQTVANPVPSALKEEETDEYCTLCGFFLVTCHQENVPDLFLRLSKPVRQSFVMDISTFDCTHGCHSIPAQGSFSSCWNHVANILHLSENPGPGLATQTLSVSKCH